MENFEEKIKPKLSVAKPKVSMDLYKSGILVTGSTFAIKNTLMENGGKWNKSLNGWMFTKSHLDEVIEGLTEEEIELTIGEGVIYGVNIHPRNIQK
jgi:maltoporin